MIRGLRYWIQFATGNELTLVHEMTLDKDKKDEGLHESFSIEGAGVHGADFTPAQLALFHCAIREMGRMSESLHMTLLDGEQPEPATLTVGEADLVSADDIKLLRMLSEGVTLEMGHPALSRFRNRGWVDVTDATDGWPTSEREYGITNAGRRALAAQTPEAESEPPLDSDQRWILSHMTDGSMLVWDPTVGDGQTVTIENGHGTLTKHELDLLHRSGYIAYDADRSTSVGAKRYYAITAKGRAVLDAQAPS